MSRTEHRRVVALETDSQGPDPEASDSEDSAPVSAVRVLGLCATFAISEAGCPRVAESERRRLIGEILRVMTNSPLPEATRVAGLTLMGWLARRRRDEEPHAIGIPEARESERRCRAKAR